MSAMARFADLPTELLHQIMYQLQPDDLDNMILTSQHFYFASDSVLAEHRILKRKYSIILHVADVPQGPSKELSPVHHLPCLLKAIVDCPRIGFYIKKIVIRGISDRWITGSICDGGLTSDAIAQNPRCSEDDLALFRRTASRFPALSPYPIASNRGMSSSDLLNWHQSIDDGDHAALLALIILHCPNLSTLDFDSRASRTKWIFDFIERINENKGCNPLSHLKHVRFKQSRPDPHFEPFDIRGFLSLPAIEAIEVHQLNGVQHHGIGSPMPCQNSNVHSLTLTRCGFDSMAIFGLLEATRHLKSFTLHRTGMVNYWIRATLLAFAKDSLEYLSLHANIASGFPQNIYAGQLSMFTALKTLELDAAMLEIDRHSGIGDLRTHLPPSLQFLRLDCFLRYFNGLDIQLGLIMSDTFERKTFPHLRKITLIDFVENESGEYTDVLHPLREGFARQGVEFQAKERDI